MGGLAAEAAHLDGAGQLIGQALLIRRNGDGDALTDGVAAEVIHAIAAAGIGLEEVTVSVRVVQGEVVVIHTRHLLLGAHQPGELQLHRLAGLDFGILRQLIALGVQQLVADATGGDDLIGGHAVLLYPDDMAAGGEVRHRHGAGLGVHGDTLRGEAVEGHGLTHGGAGHGNGAAALRSEGVAGAVGAQIEQDVVLGIQLLLLIIGDAGIHTIHEHIGLDGGAVSAHGYHKHTGELRPDGGEGLVGGAALALLMGHGVVGDLHQRRTLMVGGHIGQAAVVGIGSDAHHVAGLAVEVHHLVVGIRQGDLGVHEALNGLPVTEHIQLIGVAGVHVHVALGVDVQIHIAQIVGVLIEPADGILVEIVVHVQIVTGHDDILIGGPLVEVPIGHTVGILHPHEVVQVALRRPIGHGDGVAVLGGGAVLQRTEELVGIVVAEGTHADGGAGRSRHLHSKGLGYGDGEGLSAAAHLRDNGLGANVVIRSMLLGGDQVHRHGIRLHEDTRGAEIAVNGAAAQRGSALHAVGGGHLIVDGVVGACHPAAVAGIDLIGTLQGDGGGIVSDGQHHAAVAVLVGVIAVRPIGAGGQGHRVLQAVAVRLGADAGQQILRPLHAILVGVQLQAVQLCVVQALQLHGMHVAGDHLDGSAGVHQRIGRMRVIGGGDGHQTAGGRTLHHSEGRLAVFIRHNALDGLDRTGSHIHPRQAYALQRLGSSLCGIGIQCLHALDGNGDVLTGGHGRRNLQPGVVVVLVLGVAAHKVVQHIAVQQLGIRHLGPGSACLIGGEIAVDIEAVEAGLTAKDLALPIGVGVDGQILLGRSGGKLVAVDQLMGRHQRIQHGDALHLVGETVLLGGVAGHLQLLVHALQIGVVRLRADGQPQRLHGLARHLADKSAGIHQSVHIVAALCHQIAGGLAAHGEGGLTVLIRHNTLDGLDIAVCVHPSQTHALQGPGSGLQLRSILIAIALHGIEALHRHGDGLAGHHGLRDIDPRIVVGISILVGIEEEIHGVAVIELGVDHGGAVVAGAGGCLGAVIGIAGVDIEAADIGLRAVQLGDKAAAADLQEILGGLRGKVVAEGQLVGNHQRIQSGNALHLVGVAVLLRLTAGKFTHHGLVQPCAAVLRPNQHLGVGGSNRRVVRLHLHVDGVDLCRLIALVHGGPAGVAALDGDGGTVHSGNHRRALILRLAHIGPDLIVLVAGGGGDQHAVGPLVHRQGILMGVLIKGRAQLTGAEGQTLDRLVIVVPAAAQIGAVAIAGIHDPDLVAGSQRSVRHGEGPKAVVGEPVVQGAHPAGHGAAVKRRQPRNGADIVVLGACLLVAVLFQCLYNTAHHGRIFIQIYPFLHQCPLPGSALGFRVGGVLHDDMNLSVVVVRRKNAHGYQRQYHHQRQKQRYNTFLHSLLSSLLQIYFEGRCPKNTTHKKEAGGVAETPPALMEMDGLTAPRLAFLFHAGQRVPAPHEKHPLPMAGSPVFAFAQQKSTIQAGPCKLQSVSRFGFGDGKTKAQSSVYLTYPVSAGITVTNSPGFSPDSAADAQGAGRSVLLLT